MPLPAGAYSNRVLFERRAKVKDGYGNKQGPFEDLFKVWAAFRPAYGKEQIAGGGLLSSVQGVLTIRRSAASAGVVADDRVTFTGGPFTGLVCNIRSIVPTPDNSEIEMTLEANVIT